MSEEQTPTTFMNALAGIAKGESWAMTHWKQGAFICKGASGNIRLHGRGSVRDFKPCSSNFNNDWIRYSTALEDVKAKLEKCEHAFEISEQFVIAGRIQIASLEIELRDERGSGSSAYNQLANLHANQKRVIARLQQELDAANMRTMDHINKVACPPAVLIDFDKDASVKYWQDRAELAEAHIASL